MAHLTGKARADHVRQMFARIAPRYDLVNRWMTWGQDIRWRREVLNRAQLPVGGRLLDVGTGTGDLSLETLYRDRTAIAIGVDFSPVMMRQGRLRTGGEFICWVNADALEMPFSSGTFDSVVSGYLIRNVIDVERALAEQYRILKRGGTMVCLDTSPLPHDLWHLPSRVYVRLFIPMIGKLIAGDAGAYEYLPQSTERFLKAEELVDCIAKVGFQNIKYRRLMGGAMAIHWGVK